MFVAENIKACFCFSEIALLSEGDHKVDTYHFKLLPDLAGRDFILLIYNCNGNVLRIAGYMT